MFTQHKQNGQIHFNFIWWVIAELRRRWSILTNHFLNFYTRKKLLAFQNISDWFESIYELLLWRFLHNCSVILSSLGQMVKTIWKMNTINLEYVLTECYSNVELPMADRYSDSSCCRVFWIDAMDFVRSLGLVLHLVVLLSVIERLDVC